VTGVQRHASSLGSEECHVLPVVVAAAVGEEVAEELGVEVMVLNLPQSPPSQEKIHQKWRRRIRPKTQSLVLKTGASKIVKNTAGLRGGTQDGQIQPQHHRQRPPGNSSLKRFGFF